jgi:hypothetical protein
MRFLKDNEGLDSLAIARCKYKRKGDNDCLLLVAKNFPYKICKWAYREIGSYRAYSGHIGK